MISRAKTIAFVLLAALLAAPRAGVAQTATFPSQRITIVVPSAAGGATDIIARVISQHLGKALNQTVVVENRSGANGNIGALSVVRAPPDGHTLLLAATNNLVTNQFTMANMGFDPIADLAPVAFVSDAPELVAVTNSFPAKDMKEFIDAVRAKPGAYNYGTPGAGTVPHLSVERLLRATGTKMTHVPYRGSAAAMVDVASGGIQMTMATLGSIEPFRQAGTARVLGIAGRKRLKSIPDIPTFDEQGLKNLEMSGWWGVLAPRGTSQDTIQFLNAKLRDAFSNPENVETLGRLGIVAYAESVDYFEKFILRELGVWEAVIKDIGLKPE